MLFVLYAYTPRMFLRSEESAQLVPVETIRELRIEQSHESLLIDCSLFELVSALVAGEQAIRNIDGFHKENEFDAGVLYLCGRLSTLLVTANPKRQKRTATYHQRTTTVARALRSNP